MRQRDGGLELEKGATGRMVMGSPLFKFISCRIPNGGADAELVQGEPTAARQVWTMRLCGSLYCQTRTLIQLRSLQSLVSCRFPNGPLEAVGRRAFLPVSTQHQGAKQMLCEARIGKGPKGRVWWPCPVCWVWAHTSHVKCHDTWRCVSSPPLLN